MRSSNPMVDYIHSRILLGVLLILSLSPSDPCRQASTTSAEPSTYNKRDGSLPQSRLLVGWQPNLQRMLSDIVPLLSMEVRAAFRNL